MERIGKRKDERFWPIEIKWTHQLRSKDLQQIAKYKNGKIWAKTEQAGAINGTEVEPLPMALLQLS